MCKLGVISQEWLNLEVKLLLSANRQSYVLHQLAQQITLSDLEWPCHTLSSCFISVCVFACLLVICCSASIQISDVR